MMAHNPALAADLCRFWAYCPDCEWYCQPDENNRCPRCGQEVSVSVSGNGCEYGIESNGDWYCGIWPTAPGGRRLCFMQLGDCHRAERMPEDEKRRLMEQAARMLEIA